MSDWFERLVGFRERDAADIKARAEVAVMTTMAKAQGQELSEDDQRELLKQAKEAQMMEQLQQQQQQQ